MVSTRSKTLVEQNCRLDLQPLALTNFLSQLLPSFLEHVFSHAHQLVRLGRRRARLLRNLSLFSVVRVHFLQLLHLRPQLLEHFTISRATHYSFAHSSLGLVQRLRAKRILGVHAAEPVVVVRVPQAVPLLGVNVREVDGLTTTSTLNLKVKLIWASY